MASLKSGIVGGLAVLAFWGCGSSGAGTEGAIAESASAVTAPTWVEGAPQSCADLCGSPTCSCVHSTCSIGVAGQACGTAGARCTAVSGQDFYLMRCVAPPPPPQPTNVWVVQYEGYQFDCSDQCGAPTCACVHEQCDPSLAGQPCSTVGQECNAVGGLDYSVLTCTTQ